MIAAITLIRWKCYMRSKHLVRFYDEHCSRAIAKISGCEKALMDSQTQLKNMHEQEKVMQQDLSALWEEILGKAVIQRDIFTLKRKEALILVRHDELQLKIQEIKDSVDLLIDKRDDFIRIRLHYEKKKKKWEWISERTKKMRFRNQLQKDEHAVEECVTWVTQ